MQLQWLRSYITSWTMIAAFAVYFFVCKYVSEGFVRTITLSNMTLFCAFSNKWYSIGDILY